MVAADSGNGVSAALDWREHLFINTDLSVHLLRPPEGEWVCLEARTLLGSLGMADTALWDERGRIGRAVQTLLVARQHRIEVGVDAVEVEPVRIQQALVRSQQWPAPPGSAHHGLLDRHRPGDRRACWPAQGTAVYATARRPESIEDLKNAGCKTLALDVNDEASMSAAVAAVEEAEGAVGALVNNAGYSQSGARGDDRPGRRSPPVRDQRVRPAADVPAGAARDARARAAAGS